jgi:acyl-CoA reductase-like NAD-dependent aldehyde dehydrogenase
VQWALASAFSNAGQRCASASRLVVFDRVYEAFRDRLLAGVRELDPQPVISRESMERISAAVERSVDEGAHLLVGGERLDQLDWIIQLDLVFEAAKDPEMHDFVVIVTTDPPGYPISQHCAQHRARQKHSNFRSHGTTSELADNSP